MGTYDDSDVLIVGYGPIGQVMANLLARQGWNVIVVERWPQAYPMPRATSFDGESARILAAAGIADLMAGLGEPTRDYSWENGDGHLLFRVDVDEHGWSGWSDSTSMYQPALEAALAARATTWENLRIFRGHEAVGLADRGDDVELTVHAPGGLQRISARWVIGCDGANSFVRESAGFTMTDLHFRNDWLTCDVVLNEHREFSPNNLQVCDPARPRSAISAGPGHRRWEFMRLPGESLEQLGHIDNVWRLLGMFGINPDNAKLERHTVYTFEARYANQWRAGRVLLAGDAAHLMPPFAGQGMCSGFRDAANLAWKLDLVLRGQAGDYLLDSYTVERVDHVRRAIAISMDLGRIIGQTDPAAARDRDQVMISARERGVGPPRREAAVQPLAGGVLNHSADGRPVAPAGALFPQARVSRGAETGHFDEVVGLGFVLITTEPSTDLLDADRLALLEQIGVRLVHVLPAGSSPGPGVADTDNVYLPYLARHAALAALVRPDYYLFGMARNRADLAALIGDLCRQLSAKPLVG